MNTREQSLRKLIASYVEYHMLDRLEVGTKIDLSEYPDHAPLSHCVSRITITRDAQLLIDQLACLVPAVSRHVPVVNINPSGIVTISIC